TPQPRGSGALGGLGWIGNPGTGSYVASEPDGASNWFPANDHPGDKATFSFGITTPEGVEAVANGTRTGMETKDGRTTWSWSARDPMATYLATVAIGQYTFFEGEAPGGLPLLSAVADEVVERAGRAAVERALGELPQMVTVLSQRFGPYPFEIYGVIVVAEPLGFALETQTRSIFGDDLWAVPVIQAHELAHQWYGDSVGLEQWEDIWLNEGFATMGEWLWAEGTGGRGGPPLSGGSAYDPPLDPGPDDLFSTSVYQRGGLTLKALREEVGDEQFFEILSTWAADHRLGTATTDEFLELVEQVGGADAAELVRSWLTDPEPPG
ncbi:MAG: M1 family metallopeptidase, partial [Microthrixaceae bacterium]|nr:M1 family metallopeptidase [Microthrixaceae bacterium]